MSEPTFKIIDRDLAQRLFDSCSHDVYVSYDASDGIERCYVDPNKMRPASNPTFYITTELHNKLMNKRTPQQALVESRPAQEAWLAGKPLQYKHISQIDYKDYSPSSNIDVPYFLDPSFHWRPKPEPEKVPFNQQTIPADAWFRFKDNTTNFHRAYKVTPKGISLYGTFYTYEQLTEWVEHSTDRVNWQPCYTLKIT